MLHNFIASEDLGGSIDYIKKNKEQIQTALNFLDEAMGILQHHDAVAGTEKQHVNDDYITTVMSAVD